MCDVVQGSNEYLTNVRIHKYLNTILIFKYSFQGSTISQCIVHPLDYSYSDLDEAATEDSFIMDEDTTAIEPTEAEYEKMLLENLSTEESDHELEETSKKKKSR